MSHGQEPSRIELAEQSPMSVKWNNFKTKDTLSILWDDLRTPKNQREKMNNTPLSAVLAKKSRDVPVYKPIIRTNKTRKIDD